MIEIKGDFLTLTAKVRKNGNSFIVGLPANDCKFAGIEKGSTIQIFMRKLVKVEEVVENESPQEPSIST